MIPTLLALLSTQLVPALPSELALHRVGIATDGTQLESALLGNGRFAARVQCGTYVRIDLSHADARSESGRRIGVGSFELDVQSTNRVVCDSSLLLDEGRLRITYGPGQPNRILELYVEPDRDVLHIAGVVDDDAFVTLTGWLRAESAQVLRGDELRAVSPVADLPIDLEVRESPDVLAPRFVDRLVMFHRNETSILGLARGASKPPDSDPLLHLTSGTWVEAPGFRRVSTSSYAADSIRTGSFHIRIAASCAVTKDAESWIDGVARLAASSADESAARARTAAWWRSYFAASRIEVAPPSGKTPDGDASIVSRAYAIERWTRACTARFRTPLPREKESELDRAVENERGARILAHAASVLAAFRFPRAPEATRSGDGFAEELESMLVRTEGEGLRVLPTWPPGWDVTFRIQVPGPTVVDGAWRSGVWTHLATEPQREIIRVLPSAR